MESIFHLAHLVAGPDAAARLKGEMLPSITWGDSNVLEYADDKHMLAGLKMPQNHASIHRAVVRSLLPKHRGSDIVAFLPKACCEALPSKIHGLGVFATRDIPAFSYITMYPCDGVKWQPTEWRHDSMLATSCYATGWAGNTREETISYSQNLPPTRKTASVGIMGDPTMSDDPHFLAHIINDGAMCKRPEAVNIYSSASMTKMNSSFDAVLMAQFSVRDIAAGEEILNHYGEDYWLDLARERRF